MITIEKNVPLPDGQGSDTRSKYPTADMEVGDSFAIVATYQRAYSIMRNANKLRAPKKFTMRRTEEGYRIWRIV